MAQDKTLSIDDTGVMRVSKETSERLKVFLDENSILGDGYAVIALFELEQALIFVPPNETLRNSLYQAFAYIAMGIYRSKLPDSREEDVVKDLNLCQRQISIMAYN